MITKEKVSELFSKEKIRFTPQRQYIIEELVDNRTHPTVAAVYERVRARYSNLSLATVYQTFTLLRNNGLLREIKVEELSHFDPDMMPHDHGVCTVCGDIVDLPCDGSETKIVIFDNFIPVSREVIYKGICLNCNKN